MGLGLNDGDDFMKSEVLFQVLGFDVTLSLFMQWVVMAILSVIAIIAGRTFNRIPSNKQAAVEIFIEKLESIVVSSIGKDGKRFMPYIGTLVLYLLFLNLMGLFGIMPPTSDYNVALGLAIISFLVIQANAIKKVGIGHYFKGYAEPFSFLLPLNIIERFVFPVSLSLRLFGNMFAASLIMEILYEGLSNLSVVAMVGLPIPFHAYFDVFDGTLQMVVFVLLTMTNIKIISEH